MAQEVYKKKPGVVGGGGRLGDDEWGERKLLGQIGRDSFNFDFDVLPFH